MKLPSKWVILDVSWGEKRKHLYCPDNESVDFFKSYAEAKAEVQKQIQNGAKMMAVCEIKHLFEAQAVEMTDLVETH